MGEIAGIGEAAGQVWQFLHENGRSTLKGVQKGTGLKARQLNRAIGWLAREEKIRIEADEKEEALSLRE